MPRWDVREGPRPRLNGHWRPIGRWEVHLERRPLSWLAVNPDVAAVLLDDAVDSRQPEAGAVAALLGREEWLEDPGAGRGVHARSGVAHCQDTVLPRARFRVFAQVVVVEIDRRELDGDPPLPGDRVAGVHDQ